MADHLVGNSAYGEKPIGAHEFDFVEAVFANQSQILQDSTKAAGIELLTNLAGSVGINTTAFAAGPAPPTSATSRRSLLRITTDLAFLVVNLNLPFF